MSWVMKVWLGLCAIIAEAWERLRDATQDEDDSCVQEGAGSTLPFGRPAAHPDPDTEDVFRPSVDSFASETFAEDSP